MKNIAQKLGLAAEAGEDAMLAEVARLQSRLTTLEPLEAENFRLKNRIRQIDEDAVAGLLAERKITDERILNRLKPVLANYATRDERVAFLDDCGFKPEAAPAPAAGTQMKLRNRDTRPPQPGKPSEAAASETPMADPAKAVKIMNRARELQKVAPNLCDATAVIMAQREFDQHDAGPNY
jgi:hypothetical protein